MFILQINKIDSYDLQYIYMVYSKSKLNYFRVV